MTKVLNMLGVMAMSLLPALDAHACTKTVRWYDDAPYSYRGPDGQITGFDADLTRAILKRMGCEAVFVEMPWARALAELEAGRLDVLPSSFRSAERDAFAYFSKPSLQSPNLLYLGPKARSAYKLSKLDDIIGTRFQLGVQIGVSYGDVFDKLKANPRFKENQVSITQRRNAWKMMELGRIDGMIADEASAALELQQLGLADTLTPSGVIVSTNTAMVAFSKRSVSPQDVAAFNKALQAMIADGEYRKIRERYLRCPGDIKVLGCG
ncbi:MAG: transporter substrate-binding domain-containing protein [Telluria sp.]